ncbi:hypothetical protein MINTM003_33210 [Mycobacterium paraintracellulare]|nr:hypothetical protein MINTM003_33210 [Mycobacterium paraintracellulare]
MPTLWLRPTRAEATPIRIPYTKAGTISATGFLEKAFQAQPNASPMLKAGAGGPPYPGGGAPYPGGGP